MTTSLLRASLDDAWDAAVLAATEAQGPDLRAQLRASESKARALIASGSIQSSSGAGASSTDAGYGAGQVTATQWVEGWRLLIDLYDRVKAALTDYLGEAPTEQAIKDWMMARLVSVKEAYTDYQNLRLPDSVPIQSAFTTHSW